MPKPTAKASAPGDPPVPSKAPEKKPAANTAAGQIAGIMAGKSNSWQWNLLPAWNNALCQAALCISQRQQEQLCRALQ